MVTHLLHEQTSQASHTIDFILRRLDGNMTEERFPWACTAEAREFLSKNNIDIKQQIVYSAEHDEMCYRTFGVFPEELLPYWILKFE